MPAVVHELAVLLIAYKAAARKILFSWKLWPQLLLCHHCHHLHRAVLDQPQLEPVLSGVSLLLSATKIARGMTV